VVFLRGAHNRSAVAASSHHSLYDKVVATGLFDPEAYLANNPDVRAANVDPWMHFQRHGLEEGRPFTSPESIAPHLARAQQHFAGACAELEEQVASVEADPGRAGARLRARRARIGIYCSRSGNFYMQEIADLLAGGLQSVGIDAVLRHEESSKDETFDIHVFVAPHEFFHLGVGGSWADRLPSLANVVMFNVEQPQTQWFCKAFPMLLKASLVIDISFQGSRLLRGAGCDAVAFTPGYMESTPYTVPCLDVSDIGLVRGYGFAAEPYDWKKRDRLGDRPIDVLFVGARTEYRDETLARLGNIAEGCRFLCAYRAATQPFTAADPNGPAGERNWALSQRAKIVLNLHRDWIGCFEWSRIVLRGIWQGACVVSDRGLPNPVFEAGTHYLEESPRHLPELIRWLLATEEGKRRIDATRRAGYRRAKTAGAMQVALVPMLDAFEKLLGPSAR
jgi:hypothetical protein